MPRSIRLALTFYGGVSLAVFQAGVAYELVRAVQFSRLAERRRLTGAAAAVAAPNDANPPDPNPANPDQARPNPSHWAAADLAAMPQLHVDVISGTSSGGMAAIQLVMALGGTHPEGVLAQMLRTWIEHADFNHLIPAPNCTEQGLLSTAPSRAIMTNFLRTARKQPSDPDGLPQRLEPDLDCYLALTNLSGLREPVVLSEPARPGGAAQHAFPTTRHCEHEHIRAADVIDSKPLQEARIVDAVLATAGFPVAFAPISRHSSEVREDRREEERTSFLYIDGGVVDNQPLTIALDALAERPASDRRLFFVDPRITWAQPGYGPLEPDLTDLDPLSVYLRLSAVARADSIHQDLERLRRMRDDLDLLAQMQGRVFRDDSFRQALLAVYPDLVTRRFHAGAWALWQLIAPRGDASPALVGPTVQQAWAAVCAQERFALRARLGEYLNLLAACTPADLGVVPFPYPVPPALAAARALVADQTHWVDYYQALDAVRALDARFRQLRYEVWEGHLGLGRTGPLDAPLQAKITAALSDLHRHAETLRQVRLALIEAVADALVGPAHEAVAACRADFLDYARAMQVLESLAGVSLAGELRVRRITPFDLYADSSEREQLSPVAGGSLGAFGGFLHREWRENDFLVGRLVMRRWLRDEGLVPADCLSAYLDWSRGRDLALATHPDLAAAERGLLQRLWEIDRPLPPYADDETKPDCLLRRPAMALERLPGSRVLHSGRALLRSLRRVQRQNCGKPLYRLLGLLSPALLALRALSWALERSLLWPTLAGEDSTDAVLRRARWLFNLGAYLALGLALALGVLIGLGL